MNIINQKLQVVSLYEKDGYTSLGPVQTTFPNYLLWDQKERKYQHASKLIDESAERSGRLKIVLPFSVSGKVIHGKGQGKKLGFATANMDCYLNDFHNGVYGAFATLRNVKMLAVCSVVPNVTFGEVKSSFEVHLIDSNGKPMLLEDFYGETLHVEIIFYLRPMLKYQDLNTLIDQIEQDISRFIYHQSVTDF